MPWSGSIAGCFWLKEKHQETEQHPSVNTGSPCLSARGFTATHRGCHCSVNLMQRSLPFYLDHVTVLLAVRACWVCFGAILPVLECDGSSYSRRLLKGRAARILTWSGAIAVKFWLKKKNQQMEKHPLQSTGCPYFCARRSPETHRGCHCSIILIQGPLPSYPDHVTVLLAVSTRWVWVGAILPVLESVGSSSLQLTSQGESGQDCAVVWFYRSVFLAETEAPRDRAASL